MYRAILEIGSNSIKSLVADVYPSGMDILHEDVVITRLAEGLSKTGIITPLAFSKTINAIGVLKQECESYSPLSISAIGTMALRTAFNADEFIEAVRREHRLQIRILNGAEEAHLSFRGAISIFKEIPKSVLVFDTGGGSTEFIRAMDGDIDRAVSLNLAAHHLKHLFGTSDPINSDDYNALCSYTTKNITENIPACVKPVVIGIGGTPVYLAAIHGKHSTYSAHMIDGYKLKLDEINAIIDKLRSLPDDKRKQVTGLPPDRSDIILYGAVIVKTVLEVLSVDQIVISSRGVRHGEILSM